MYQHHPQILRVLVEERQADCASRSVHARLRRQAAGHERQHRA